MQSKSIDFGRRTAVLSLGEILLTSLIGEVLFRRIEGNMQGPYPLPGNPYAVSVGLDGSGNGQVQAGPTRPREHWQLTGGSVKVATNTKEATCDIYKGNQISSATFFSHSITGSTGDICGFGGLDLQPGQQIFAVWEGGDAAETATLSVTGTYTIGTP